jgi:hypothetical protein
MTAASEFSAPRSACPPIADPKLAKVLDEAGVMKQLRGIVEAQMYEQAGRLVQQLNGSVYGVAPADPINGLTAAYCPLVRSDATLDENAKALKLGRFANYIYMAVTDRTALARRKEK